MVKAVTLDVKGENNNIESCHRRPNSTKDIVGTIDNRNNNTEIDMHIWGKSRDKSTALNISQYCTKKTPYRISDKNNTYNKTCAGKIESWIN